MLDGPHIFDVINVETVAEMQKAVLEQVPEHDVFISAAAVSDYIPMKGDGVSKISSSQDTILKLKKAPKIINEVKL